MPYEILISEAALDDIESSQKWYKEINEELALRIKNEILATIEKIKANLLICSKKYRDVRVAFLTKIPFGIHYQVKQDQIKIIAFFHMSLVPKRWARATE